MKFFNLENCFLERAMIVSIPFCAIFSIFFLDFFLLFLSISFVIRSFKEKNYQYYLSKFFLIFIIFYFYILIRYLLRDHSYSSFSSVVFYFRYGFYVIALSYFFNKIKNLENFFLNSILVSVSLLLFDSFIQFIFGTNIIGYEIVDKNRLSSFFGDESILGSYLLKFLPFLYLIITKNLNNKKIFVFTLFLIAFSDIIIFLSGERASFILMVLLTIYFIFMFKNLRLIRIVLFGVTTIIIVSIFFNSDPVSKRYLKTVKEIVKNDDYVNNLILDKSLIDTKYYIISPTHHNYFLTALNMFKDNKIFGQGPRSYRYLCDDDNFKINKYSCSTHPHNYYMQILAELGLIGFIFLMLFYLYICYRIILIIVSKEPKNNSYMICILSFFLINLWPLTSTGNFFNNWISILIYLPFSFFLLDDKKR